MFDILRIIVSILAICGLSTASVIARAGKPTGGPAQMTITIYSGPFTCPAPDSQIPTDGSAGTVLEVATLAENTCVITPFPLNSTFTATITVPPKTGTIACHAQIFTESGCGLTLTNEYHGYPINGMVVGSQLACANPYGRAYGAVAIVCA